MSTGGKASVVHVLGRLDVGGAERMLFQIAGRLVAEGHSKHAVVALSGMRGRLSEVFEAAGVPDVPCGLRPLLTFPLRLWRTLQRIRPDVVVSHVSLASGLVLLVAAIAGVRVRVAVMHSDGDGRSLSLARRVYRRLSRGLLATTATTIVGVTSSTLAFSGRRAGRDARVVPNAVDLDYFSEGDRKSARSRLGLSQEVPVLLHVGRAAPEKNRRALLPCLRAVADDAVLLMAGADTLEDLGDIADEDRSRLVNAGLVDDVRPLMAASDVLLLPSVREGLPLVVLEALASGRPVVATDLPGIRAACAGYEDVTLVPAGSPPETFASHVREVLSAGRAPTSIRATVQGSSHDLERALDEWRLLCQPRT